jgi:hypothetical protein
VRQRLEPLSAFVGNQHTQVPDLARAIADKWRG